MSKPNNPKGSSITEAASKMVSEWSDSKRAAFEQRTGLVIGSKTNTRNIRNDEQKGVSVIKIKPVSK